MYPFFFHSYKLSDLTLRIMPGCPDYHMPFRCNLDSQRSPIAVYYLVFHFITPVAVHSPLSVWQSRSTAWTISFGETTAFSLYCIFTPVKTGNYIKKIPVSDSFCQKASFYMGRLPAASGQGFYYYFFLSVSAELRKLQTFISVQCHANAPGIDEQKQRISSHIFYFLHI